MMSEQVDRPIFFVGAPRSGTTILFEAFSSHPDLAWFSNYLYRFPRFPVVSLFSRLAISNDLLGAKRQNGESAFRIPRPYAVECYPAWELCCGQKFRFDYLLNQKASQEEKDKVVRLVDKVTRYQSKHRFATKITGPTRMAYLNSIFPDALFIHVVRDGRAVVNSLMKVDFWKNGGGYHKPWWRGGLTEEDIELYDKYGKTPVALTAVQWRRIMLMAREEAKAIGPGQYLEIRYEDALRDPIAAMDGLFTFSHLAPSSKVHDYIRTKSAFKDMNYKFAKDLKSSDVGALDEILGDVNAAYGYPSLAMAMTR